MPNLKPKKIIILLPDGVGLRNFAFTSFVEIGEMLGWEIIFWNHTPFDLTTLEFQEIKLKNKPRPITDLLKRAKINAELNYFEKKFKDPIYQSYKFPAFNSNLKVIIKNSIVSIFTLFYQGEKGLQRLRKRLKSSERGSDFYKQCKKVLEKEKPDLVFCTNQRPVNAISPLLAAQDLNIPTASFIFSWDNLPKATMVVETDYYFVWSELMLEQLLKYYPSIDRSQIIISGTPQFEAHYKDTLILPKEVFFQEQGLDLQRNYICFSGDDMTTSPDDPQYLEDVAAAVTQLNLKGAKIGIIFRRCPVDFSGRYSSVINTYKEIITEIAPLWEKHGNQWNMILPLKEDIALQVNTIYHSLGIINLGSTMIFDAVAHNKPCFYINYDVIDQKDLSWSVRKIYNFVHFRSMPKEHPVIWLNSKKEISEKIEQIFILTPQTTGPSIEWFKIINQHPPQDASKRIWLGLNAILKK